MKHWQEIWQRPVVRAVTLGIGVLAVYLVGNNFFTVEDVPPAFSETVASPKVTGVQPLVFPKSS